MRVSHVEFEIVIAVSGVRAIGADFVLDPIVYSLNVRLQLVISDESFCTLWTWKWFHLLLGSFLPTPSFLVLLQPFENTSTFFTCFQQLTCVLPPPMRLQIWQKGCGIITMGTLLELLFLVKSFNVDAERVLSGICNTTLRTRDVFLVFRLHVGFQKNFLGELHTASLAREFWMILNHVSFKIFQA